MSIALMVLLGLITGGLVCVARLDTEQLEVHLDYSWGIGRLFAIGAFFCLFLQPATQRGAMSMCAGGAAGCFAYHAACQLAARFRR